MSVHFIIKCKKCDKVTGECKCPAKKEKPIRWITCNDCSGFKEWIKK